MDRGSCDEWWRGKRGEWYVVGQILLMLLVFFGPRSVEGWPAGHIPFRIASLFVGAALAGLGAVLFVAGVLRLGGSNLTPMPRPREHGTLVESGAYGVVRHPMYSGGLGIAFGWALLVGSWLTLAYAVMLFVFADIKSRREERWLAEKFPEYEAYRRRVRKLVPFIY